MAWQFSEDGKYFAQISTEGKLKIWNTLSNTFEQEFSPDFQSLSLCTSLRFLYSEAYTKHTPNKKRRRKGSIIEPQWFIAVGTSSGRLLLYSLVKGDVDVVIDSKTSQSINCISSNIDECIYSGTDTYILVWNVLKRNFNSKWSCGNDKVSAILTIPSSNHILTASKSIKLWDIKSQEVIKTYCGHSSQISLLHYINSTDSSEAYFISGSKGDRLLNCWSLKEDTDGKHPVVCFLMEDIVNNLSVHAQQDKICVAATVRSGVVHAYSHVINGKKNTKPIKPKTTIQVVSNSEEEKSVLPIHITASTYRDTQEVLSICYGSALLLTFEDITITTAQKLLCLVRENPHKIPPKDAPGTNVRVPIVDNDVHYLSNQTVSSAKRKNDGQQELSLEKRLQNLMVHESEKGKVPTANNAAQLLVQALHSKDRNLLRFVLLKKDEQLIKNTIGKIPANLIALLVEELTKLIQAKTVARQIGAMWLKNVILIHSGLLLANPDLEGLFGEVLRIIETELALHAPRNKLMGRLDLLVSQINYVSPQEKENYEPALVFNDKDSTDSDSDGMDFEEELSSENEWEEGPNDGKENNVANVSDSNNEDDEAMSS